MHITGSHFFITGGASGLGAATARWLAEHGGRVTIVDLNTAALDALTTELGPTATSCACDVTSETSVQQALDHATRAHGELHGVVCCAGILAAARLVSSQGTHDLELFRRVLDVNLVGTFNVVRLAAARMMHNTPSDEGERGVVVLTSSIAAEEGQIGQAAYAASKGGINALVLPLARELGRYGIRVAALAPGVFETPLMASAPSNVRESLQSQIPFPSRFGQPSEFAAAVGFVIENLPINGSVIRLDGGLRMGAK